MSYNIQSLKNDLQGILHGTQLNQITGLDNLIYRAARQVLFDVDPQETKRVVQFVNPIFNTVYDYPIAADVKGNKLIDIRPQINRLPVSVWTQAYNQAFDIQKQNIFSMSNMFTINFNSGIKTIRINAPFLNPPTIINQIDSIAVNGTWAAAGTASNLSVNNTSFVQGYGSLQIDTTAGAAYIENSTMSAVDLSSTELQSSFFAWVYAPTGASLTSVELRVGSDSANYYSLTVTTNQEGTAFANGWNLCQFNWSSMAVTGTPVITAIDYARITLNVSADMTACKVNGLNSILGTIMEYEYYSKYMFRDVTTGAFQETITDDSNLINLDTETYNLLLDQVSYLAVQQQQGLDATFFDAPFFEKQYQQNLMRYKALYKSELQKPQSSYYPMPNKSTRRYLGPRWN